MNLNDGTRKGLTDTGGRGARAPPPATQIHTRTLAFPPWPLGTCGVRSDGAATEPGSSQSRSAARREPFRTAPNLRTQRAGGSSFAAGPDSGPGAPVADGVVVVVGLDFAG